MSDPIQPFRDEFERWRNRRRTMRSLRQAYRKEALKAKGRFWSLFYSVRFVLWAGKKLEWDAYPCPKHEQMYRVAKTLKIARDQGPDAALLWKLSN